MRTILLRTTVIVAALVALAPAAHANPEPCDGAFLIKDAAGDQGFKEGGVTLIPMPDNTDLVGVFYRLDGDKVTANLVIKDLSKTLPSGFSAIRYRSYITVGDTIHYVQALVDSSGVTYSYGSPFVQSYTEDGATQGALFEGPNGVVQIVIPPDAGGKPGTKLAATSGSVGALTIGVPPEAQLPPFYLQADTGPDGAMDGPTTTPAACAAPAATTTTTTTTTTAARITLTRTPFSAKKANAKHSARVILKASEPLTGVTATLVRAARVVGSGRLASLSGSGTMTLKLKAKVKQGAYTLAVKAKRADGSAVKATLKVTVGA